MALECRILTPKVKLMAIVIRRYEVTDAEWKHIRPYIPEEQGIVSRGRPSKDSRTMLKGIL